jgi:hypothetical protein
VRFTPLSPQLSLASASCTFRCWSCTCWRSDFTDSRVAGDMAGDASSPTKSLLCGLHL